MNKILLVGAFGIATMNVVAAQEIEKLSLGCFLEPSMIVTTGTPVPGVLSEVNVERGDIVRKNDALAQIDSRAEQAALKLSKARLDYADRRVARNNELIADGLVSPQERDELETERQLAELELNEREVQLEMRTIRSPVNGVVVDRVRAPGDFVQETEILVIAQINPLNVEVIVPVEYFGRIKTGTKATITSQAPLNNVNQVRVKVVDKVVDAASGTFRVRLQVPNKRLSIPAGLQCQAEFELT